MPKNVELNVVDAITIIEIVNEIKAEFAGARIAFSNRLINVWPELKNPGAEIRLDDIRPVEMTSKEQNALAEGFLKYCQDKSIKDSLKAKAIGASKPLKFNKWLCDMLDVGLKEFEDSDDSVSDDEG